MKIIVIQSKKIDEQWYENRVNFDSYELFMNYLVSNKGKYFKVVCYDESSNSK